MILKSLLIWALIIPLAIMNGIMRDSLVSPLIGSKYALALSGIILCVLIFIISYFLITFLGQGSQKQYLIMGVVWVILTIIFETILSLAMGNSYPTIIKSYNILTGYLWLLDIIFIGITPILVAKIQNII